MRPREVAARTRYSVQTLANHRCMGIGIPFTKLPSGRVMYRRDDVEAYLNGRLVEAA
ncbi:helix-turn-helix domain-containing protein [Streptomyces sp. NPDC001584]|uniref:helix-turn-helix transcriptional regulator n=1 Tax=Streptomyces sp. NPDC001584 TaxID=3154521 RepID=UPI00331FEA92